MITQLVLSGLSRLRRRLHAGTDRRRRLDSRGTADHLRRRREEPACRDRHERVRGRRQRARQLRRPLAPRQRRMATCRDIRGRRQRRRRRRIDARQAHRREEAPDLLCARDDRRRVRDAAAADERRRAGRAVRSAHRGAPDRPGTADRRRVGLLRHRRRVPDRAGADVRRRHADTERGRLLARSRSARSD